MTDNDFYKFQNHWSQIYFRAPDKSDIEKVAWVDSVTGQGQKRLLELGAGGGQFSVAACKAGHFVTAVEVEAEFVNHIRELIEKDQLANLQVLEKDFYEVEFEHEFDLICYWDGFGVGSDDQQRELLGKIASWLAKDGSALIEVYTPWFWAMKAFGVTQILGKVIRTYSFDFETSRLLDTWSHQDDPGNQKTQRLRCYSPADLKLLLYDLDLEIKSIYPGGSVDYETGTYEPMVSLENAMSYTVQLVRRKAG